MKNKKLQLGFTLIEIMIVIAIIGILSAATLVGLGAFRSSGADTRRTSDLTQIQNALELYFTKNGSYPTAASLVDVGTLGLVGAGIGVNSLPVDPSGGTQATTKYLYKQCGTGYVLEATLANAADNKSQSNSCDPNCTGSGTTFCISF